MVILNSTELEVATRFYALESRISPLDEKPKANYTTRLYAVHPATARGSSRTFAAASALKTTLRLQTAAIRLRNGQQMRKRANGG